MDPTKELAETRKLMASVTEALTRIIENFKQTRQPAVPSDVPVPRKS